MPLTDITLRGAREHNLQSINLVLPRDQLICLTGVSGSGKSSLAFDTLYAEGQRRYVESLSGHARHLLGQMPKPELDFVEGLRPSISIAQKTSGQSPRSTVGTITEIYDFLRLLFARVGTGHCPKCGDPIAAQSNQQIVDRINTITKGTKYLILAPIARSKKGEFRDVFDDLLRNGFSRVRVDGEVYHLNSVPSLERRARHDVDVVVDRLTAGPESKSRLAEAVEQGVKLGDGSLVIAIEASEGATSKRKKTTSVKKKATSAKSKKGTESKKETVKYEEDLLFSAHYACSRCDIGFEPPTPQLFSFNSPRGMCQSCDGLGELYGFDTEKLIPDTSRSFQQGCIELFGEWRRLGRWQRTIFNGVAEWIEEQLDLNAGDVLETAWEEVPEQAKEWLLWGTGENHITFTWRGGTSGSKWGGTFDGILPKLLDEYRNVKAKPRKRQLEKYMRKLPCNACKGERLNEQARAVRITSLSPRFGGDIKDTEGPSSLSLPQLCNLSVDATFEFFSQLELDETNAVIAEEVVKEIRGRLGFLRNVGLNYLTLSRTSPTLSGGEMQRIRLAGQIGCGLVGVLYILDEPSIGLHPRDNNRLLGTLAALRDQGNTVVVVEHDEDTMLAADHLIDFGPGPGVRGGHVVAEGTLDELEKHPESVTGQFLLGKRSIAVPGEARKGKGTSLVVRGAAHNNLKNIDVEIPLGKFVCITGVSGSGKSSLVSGILIEALRSELHNGLTPPGTHDAIEGIEHLDKMIAIDQSPIGRTPRSNPATYTKAFDEIRKLYSELPDSKARGFKPGRFSFNVSGGRCEACQGNGSTKLEMDFLADVWVACPVCNEHRFNHETLAVKYKGKSISEVLEMDIQEALEHFQNIPKIAEKLQALHDVGLDYIKLGQPSPTLSGGEAQRVKLAKELSRRSTGRTLYVLDEPTTGLHFADIEMLLKVLHHLVDLGNTVLVVEHNLDVVKTADWVIDLGPEGGAQGGYLVAEGTPQQVQESKKSETGEALAKLHKNVRERQREIHQFISEQQQEAAALRKTSRGKAAKPADEAIIVRGAQENNLRNISSEIPRDKITVCSGPSGSGKTSFAMDTVYAEGQRRYVESLSSYARQFIGQMQKPKVEQISGLAPAIAIEQHRGGGGTPRSTVGTITEVYDYLRIIMSRLGVPHCPDCNLPIGTQSTDEVIAKVMEKPEGTQAMLLAPLNLEAGPFATAAKKENGLALWRYLQKNGYVRVRVNEVLYQIEEETPPLDMRQKNSVEVVIDRLVIREDARGRVADSVESALSLGEGLINILISKGKRESIESHSQHYSCDSCGRSFETLLPHHFSFNSAIGWCPACEGLGVETGTSVAALISDPKRSLREGAVSLWPSKGILAEKMLEAFSEETDVPVDVPFETLSSIHRRMILQGTGDRHFTAKLTQTELDSLHGGDVAKPKTKKKTTKKKVKKEPTVYTFSFQYRGLYPALALASRSAPALRVKLDHLVDEVECSVCLGGRLRDDALAVRLFGNTIDELTGMPLGKLLKLIKSWKATRRDQKVAGEIIRELVARIGFLVDVGLEYLSLNRGAPTLSGGEMQRIRLASQVGSGLCGVLYVLDEPTIGLHPRDNARLVRAIERLRDLGNTILLVEHDREVIESADQILDFGPKAGKNGGELVAKGTVEQVMKRKKSVTGPYLSGEKTIPIPTNRRTDIFGFLEVIGARENNLQEIDVAFPLGLMTVVVGPSGSGKSTLTGSILYNALARILHRAGTIPGGFAGLRGVEAINKVIRVDSKPIGQTPASSPATYTGVFDLIRLLFAQLPESKLRGYSARRFSFNVPGGRCERCEGAGQLCVEMHFLPDVWVECEECRGKRYNEETLAVLYRGHSIADVLEMSCAEAAELFQDLPKIRRTLNLLCDVGLDYVALGQSAPTLSGGEAQRVRLASELARPDTGRTLYLLDEPTTGLHFEDLQKLLDVLNRLVDLGNTVVVVEHNLDVIKCADWLIELGPEAGEEGGQLVFQGTPEDLVKHANRYKKASKENKAKMLRSYTGECLAPVLKTGEHIERTTHDFVAEVSTKAGDLDIEDVGKDAKMPWEADGPRWHTQDRLSRSGTECQWDGKILSTIISRLEDREDFEDIFSDTDWSNRSVVEIKAAKKSDGWFLHAITGEEWLLKLKFRTKKSTFKQGELNTALGLKVLNEMNELPLYGTQPRVKCRNMSGPYQEIEIRAHSFAEIDTPAFWEFLEKAVERFHKVTDKASASSSASADVLRPWVKLGETWHRARKGFPLGRKVRWEPEILETVLNSVLKIAGKKSEVNWKNKVTVVLYPPNVDRPWCTVVTKKLEYVELILVSPKGVTTQGMLAELGNNPHLDATRKDWDYAHLYFKTEEDLNNGDLQKFLRWHWKNCAIKK